MAVAEGYTTKSTKRRGGKEEECCEKAHEAQNGLTLTLLPSVPLWLCGESLDFVATYRVDETIQMTRKKQLAEPASRGTGSSMTCADSARPSVITVQSDKSIDRSTR